MSRLLARVAAIAIAPVLLAACASLPAATPASLDGVKAFAAAEAAYDAAIQSADVAIETGQVPPATVRTIKSLADRAHAYVLAGRAAADAANATDLATQTAALTALVAQIAALSKG